MPPAVALLNHISCGILWRIFCQTGIFAGFSLYILNFDVRISAAMMAGDIIFLGCRTAYKGAMEWGDGRGILYIKASLVQWKDISLWQPEFGPEKKENHFVSGNFAGFLCIFCRKDQRRCDGWAA